MRNVITQDEFKKSEELVITVPKPAIVWVNGEAKSYGDTVTVSGNDKVQLFATKKAVFASDFKEFKKINPDAGKEADLGGLEGGDQ